MAMEGACFVLVCTQVLTEKSKEVTKLMDSPFAKTPGGGFAMIFGPDGAPLVKALEAGEEGILMADIDLQAIDYAKQMIDTVGHYSRPDLLSLKVIGTFRSALPKSIRFTGLPGDQLRTVSLTVRVGPRLVPSTLPIWVHLSH
jgi:hypothetical protein